MTILHPGNIAVVKARLVLETIDGEASSASQLVAVLVRLGDNRRSLLCAATDVRVEFGDGRIRDDQI